MILRIFHAPIRSGRDHELVDLLRRDLLAEVLRARELKSVQPAISRGSGRSELIVVSTWDSMEALLGIGRSLDTPVALPVAAELLEPGRSEHFELVLGGARAVPIVGAVLRVMRARIRPNMSSAYFDRVRRAAEPLLDAASLVALHVGRRIDAGTDEAVAVSLWSNASALDDVLEGDPSRIIGDADLAELLAEPARVQHFEAITVANDAPDAPAVLLADDERRYLYATPAAARLSGRPLSRLLTMRVEDIAPTDSRGDVPVLWASFLERGSLDGPFLLERPDGSQIALRYTARADVPWPGCHVSVLSKDDDGAPIDIEAALTAAGIVSRYSTRI